MNRSFVLVIIVIVAALLAAPAWNFQEKKPIAAYIIKVVKDVEQRSKSTSGWSKALLLSELKAGYEVRTQEKSLAIIKFADESKVSVREKSIITISGEVAGNKILNRDVYIERGRAVFDVKKQETEQFRFTSPISVASIRGTEGGTGFDPGTTISDITIITGVAEFSVPGRSARSPLLPAKRGLSTAREAARLTPHQGAHCRTTTRTQASIREMAEVRADRDRAQEPQRRSS